MHIASQNAKNYEKFNRKKGELGEKKRFLFLWTKLAQYL